MKDTIYETRRLKFFEASIMMFFENDSKERCVKIPETKDGFNAFNFITEKVFYMEPDSTPLFHHVTITKG